MSPSGHPVKRDIRIILPSKKLSPILKLLYRFNKPESFYNNNCYSNDNNTKEIVHISSPFITAVCGILLRNSYSHPRVDKQLSGICDYLINQRNKDGLVNFYEGHEKNNDLDTFSVTNIFLLDQKPDEVNRDNIIKTINRNRCHKTGAFKTWIGRRDNPVDYMVNFHIFVLFKRLNHNDERLNEYLKNNIKEFLAEGSRYYEDWGFSVFLIYYYWKHYFAGISNEVIEHIISEIWHNPIHRKVLRSILSTYYKENQTHNKEVEYYKFEKYFNSSSRTFHSDILDTLINAYLYSQRVKEPIEKNNRKMELASSL